MANKKDIPKRRFRKFKNLFDLPKKEALFLLRDYQISKKLLDVLKLTHPKYVLGKKCLHLRLLQI